MMHRIYFDGNEVDEDGRVNLGIPEAVRDIELIKPELHEGLRVLLYNSEGQELEAILEYDVAYKHWMGQPITGTLKNTE